MATSELGTKRVCAGCAAKFYDLNKDPIVCPKCGHEEVVATPKPRRPKPVEVKPEPKAEPETDAEEKEETTEELDGDATSLDELAAEEEAASGEESEEDELLAIDDEDEEDSFLADDDDDDDDMSDILPDVKSDD